MWGALQHREVSPHPTGGWERRGGNSCILTSHIIDSFHTNSSLITTQTPGGQSRVALVQEQQGAGGEINAGSRVRKVQGVRLMQAGGAGRGSLREDDVD